MVMNLFFSFLVDGCYCCIYVYFPSLLCLFVLFHFCYFYHHQWMQLPWINNICGYSDVWYMALGNATKVKSTSINPSKNDV